MLRRIKAVRRDLPVILLTAAENEEVAVAAMKEGASDYLVKRFGSVAEERKLVASVRKSLEQADLARAYRRSRDMLEETLELAWDGVAYVGLATRKIVSLNDAFCRMLDLDRADLEGRPIDLVLAPDDRRRFHELASQVERLGCSRRERNGPARGRAVEAEIRMRRRDGSAVIADLRMVEVDLEGEPCALVTARDVTEKRRLTDQLVEAQKMEAVGRLAGGIAHDFNNLLGAILGYASFLKRHIEPQSRVFKSVETIEAAAERAADLVQRLLSFARRGPSDAVPFSPNALIEETVRLLSRSIPDTIRVERRLAPDVGSVEGDETEMQQALLNVCLNARDAMPEGGTLEIRSASALGADLPAGTGAPRERRFVLIAVRDTGHGMPPEIRARIFEPFFTTKTRGKGTGLGLATAYAIVKAHGGAIDVASEVGRGTEIRIFLPASEKVVRPAAPEPPLERAERRTILVVDDEPTIRDLTHDILVELGYEVLLASSGRAALEKYAAERERIDLVILDIIMPGMDDLETFRRLREIDPQARVLLSSGYSPEGTASEALKSGAIGFVQKPYRVADLGRAVQEALAPKG